MDSGVGVGVAVGVGAGVGVGVATRAGGDQGMTADKFDPDVSYFDSLVGGLLRAASSNRCLEYSIDIWLREHSHGNVCRGGCMSLNVVPKCMSYKIM